MKNIVIFLTAGNLINFLSNIHLLFHHFLLVLFSLYSTKHISLDLKNWAAILPSFEFLNFAVALIVWSARYPSVFWSTSKSFSIIFSIQMIANAVDILLVFAGVSVVYKLQIVGQKLPLQVSCEHLIFYFTSIFLFVCTLFDIGSINLMQFDKWTDEKSIKWG